MQVAGDTQHDVPVPYHVYPYLECQQDCKVHVVYIFFDRDVLEAMRTQVFIVLYIYIHA